MELTLDQALQKGIEAYKTGNVQEADRYYTAILKASPKHPDANHNMGILAVSISKVEAALPFFKTALEANPNIAQYWLSYIDALIKLERLDDAQTVFNQAKSNGAKGNGFENVKERLRMSLKNKTNTVHECRTSETNILDTFSVHKAHKLAAKNAKEGCKDAAIAIYNDILKKFPQNKKAIKGLSQLSELAISSSKNSQDPPQTQLQSLINLYTKHKLQEAFEKSQDLSDHFPQSATVFNLQGVVLRKLGHLSIAIEAYTKAISIKPDYAEAYYNMGNALSEDEKLEEAIDAYNKAISIKPQYAEAFNNLGNALKAQYKLGKAIEAYKNAIYLKPDHAEAYNNVGNTLKEQGKLEEAIIAYKKAISIRPQYAEAFNNLGVSLNEKGSLEKAIEAFKKAFSIEPKYPDPYNNMGITLNEQGKLTESIKAYNKAISISPDYAEAHNNMGVALNRQQRLQDAIEAYKKAISIRPRYAEAYNNMGISLNKQGKLKESMEAYSKAISINSDFADAYYNMAIALKNMRFNKFDTTIEAAIVSILDRKTIVRPAEIAGAIVSLLKHTPTLNEFFSNDFNTKLHQTFDKSILALSNSPLLLKFMSVCPLPDLDLERALTTIRSYVLSNISKINSCPLLLKIQSALALQCFTNEYVYNLTTCDEESLKDLEKSAADLLSGGDQPEPHIILCLASFTALHEYDWSNKLKMHPEIKAVFIRQIVEPNEVEKFKLQIPTLEKITDKVSKKVRAQYEDNPYPRWVNTGLSINPFKLSDLVDQLSLKLMDTKILEVNEPNILIAGCGTGQHSIGTSSRFKNSKVLSIDLSLSSLAYAKRKTQELGLNDIDYMHADILKLKQLNKKFDIIESAGVLHHMDDPMLGWKELVNRLKPGGLMKIGLYSELARQQVVKYRPKVVEPDTVAINRKIRAFRKQIISSKDVFSEQIRSSNDFFCMSELRDLIFHAQEHRFTIPQIKNCLSQLRLVFCGFESDNINALFKETNAEKDAGYDLDKWSAFEEDNPTLFSGMYQFWCQKI